MLEELSYFLPRQYDNALAQIQRAYSLEPSPPAFLFSFGIIYAEKGMYREAVGEFQKLGDQPHALGHMGNAYARMGRPAEARQMMSKLEEPVQMRGRGPDATALRYCGRAGRDARF